MTPRAAGFLIARTTVMPTKTHTATDVNAMTVVTHSRPVMVK